MFIHPSALQHLVPGDPTLAALHREEFQNAKNAVTPAPAGVIDHTSRKRVMLLRAHITAGVGRFFV